MGELQAADLVGEGFDVVGVATHDGGRGVEVGHHAGGVPARPAA